MAANFRGFLFKRGDRLRPTETGGLGGWWPSKTCRISGAFASNSDAVGMETLHPMICVALVGWLFEVRVRRELVSRAV